MDLAGYCTGSLDPDETAAMEAALSMDPALQMRVSAMRRRLDALSAWPDTPAPADLAEQTVSRVSRERRRRAHARADAPTGARRFRGIDVLVAACVVVMATLLLIPAVHQARHAQRVQLCSQRLSVVGQALLHYADHYGGHFPYVSRDDPSEGAGMFGALLMESGLLDRPEVLQCPGRQRPTAQWHPPAVLEIRHAGGDPARTRALLRRASGDYGYGLGFLVGHVYTSPQRALGGTCIVVADSPYRAGPATDFSEAARDRHANSVNHDGLGQNVLYADGHVRWISVRRIGTDDIFLNAHGQVRAGTTPTDNVVGFGSDRP